MAANPSSAKVEHVKAIITVLSIKATKMIPFFKKN